MLSTIGDVKTGVSPVARALQALEILQLRPGTTAEALGECLGVSERAARRYVAILREAGVPVESQRGRYGGYRLGREGRLSPVRFTQVEALGLVMAVLEGHPEATDPAEVVGSALAKVVAVLPEAVGRQAGLLREHAWAAPDHRSAHPDPGVTSALVLAATARRRIKLRYTSAGGNQSDAEVDPWAVVVRHGLWYLLSYSYRADAVRTYRVDRITAVEETVRSFIPPEGLAPVALLEQHLGDDWAFPTRVVFEAPITEVAPWIRRPMGRLDEHPSGCVLVGRTNNPAMYAHEWLAAIPLPFCIEAGDELRAAMTALAEKCAATLRPIRSRGATDNRRPA